MALPSALGALGWSQYRKAVQELDTYQPASPVLPGTTHSIPMPYGNISYRRINGDSTQPALVLIHGWGRTGDSAWWPIVWHTDRTLIIVDLPGHGRSMLREPFTLDLAAAAVVRVIKSAELDQPVVVGHSMGGAIALLAAHEASDFISQIGIFASSAQWVKPRAVVTLAAAPYVMAPRSPFVIRRQHRETAQAPGDAGRVIWEYAARPSRKLLEESARALRTFDASEWDPASLPPITWVVSAEDGVIDPDRQRWSAQQLEATVIEVESEHSIVLDRPLRVASILEELGVQRVRRHEAPA